MAARERTATATATPMPAAAPLERPLDSCEDDEAIADVVAEAVVGGEEDTCVGEPEDVVGVEIAPCVVEALVAVATMPVEKAGSSIGMMDWNPHFTPCVLVLLVKATALDVFRKRW
jgi:hypothetical protein